MTRCAYCAMDQRDVDPAFHPEAPSLDDDEDCDRCDLPALAERSMVRTERSLAWKLRRDRGEIETDREPTRSADGIAEKIDRAWRPA